MDAQRQTPKLLSDVHTNPGSRVHLRHAAGADVKPTPMGARPRQYASDIISPHRQSDQQGNYARFYRKSVTAARQAIIETSPGQTLAHEAVIRAAPRPAPVHRHNVSSRKKKSYKRIPITTRRAANILIIITIVMSSIMGIMLYRYHLALQKVEALPLQSSSQQEAGDAEVAPTTDQLSENKPASGTTVTGTRAPNVPYKISIPKLKISAAVISVGTTKSGAMNVPGNIWQAGWYKLSAKPADKTGVVVMNGHVHGPTQPGIFTNLKKLAAGDIITVTDAAGTNYTYKVVSQKSFKASESSDDIMQSVSPYKQGLNLVTCTGQIKDDKYQDRLVVFAERV